MSGYAFRKSIIKLINTIFGLNEDYLNLQERLIMRIKSEFLLMKIDTYPYHEKGLDGKE